MEKLRRHIKTLSSLRWHHFAGHYYATKTRTFIKDEVNLMFKLLQRHMDSTGKKYKDKKNKDDGGSEALDMFKK